MSFLFGGNTEVPQDTKDEKALKHLQLINDAQFLHKQVTLLEVKILDRIKKSENGKTILKDIDEKDIRTHLLEAKKIIARAVDACPTELAHLKEIVAAWSFAVDECSNQNDANQVIGIDDVLLPGSAREINELELLDNLKHPKHGLDVKNRKYLLKTYENCFVGTAFEASKLSNLLGREAVDWMLDRKYAASRYEAVTILNRFIKFNEIAHVVNQHEFKDEYLFYRFTETSTPKYASQSQFGTSKGEEQQAVLKKALQYGSCLDWWSNEVKEHDFMIILFISFDGSLFSKVIICDTEILTSQSMLRSWNQLVDNIRDSKGEIYGVTSDPQTTADNAKAEWKLQFDILSDPLNTLAANHAHITKSGATGGIAHPGMLAVTKFKRVLYEWYVNPHLQRLAVDLPTPSAAESWAKIQQALKS